MRRPWILLASLWAVSATRVLGAHHLDASNTSVNFQIQRFGVHWFSVAFRELSGDFALAPDGHSGELTVVVLTASVDSRSPYWDERLRSAQWLDTGRYPQMVFRSTGIRLEGPARATVQGELTLHGVTRPLSLEVTDIDCPQAPAGPSGACRFVGRAALKRSDYGLPHGFWAGGDSVEIIVRGE
jgi:polyisoprenoid-binding protein YceI